jgi:hypothetical protein
MLKLCTNVLDFVKSFPEHRQHFHAVWLLKKVQKTNEI